MVLGIYDYQVIRDAAWVGLPIDTTLKWDDNASITFLTLLPSFLILSFMNLGRTNNLSILTQFVSWRKLHSMDFRDVQRANTCIGLGQYAFRLGWFNAYSSIATGASFHKEKQMRVATCGHYAWGDAYSVRILA